MTLPKRPPFVRDEVGEGDKEFAIHGPHRLEFSVYYDDLSEKEATKVLKDIDKMLRILNAHWAEKSS